MRTHFACAMLTITATLSACDQSAPPATASSASDSAARPAKIIPEDKIQASLDAAEQYLQSGGSELVKAEAILRTLIDRAPGDSRGHEMLGQVLLQKAIDAEQRGDDPSAGELRRRAHERYVEAVRLQPDSAGLQHSAGLVAMAAGDADAALQHFSKAEQIDPANPQYALFAAQLLMQRQAFDQAESSLRRVLAVDPDEPYARATLAMLALERGLFDAALEEIGRARRAMPEDAGLRAQHAKVYRRMNQPRAALELLIGLDAADRAQEAVAYEIAAAYDMLGEPAKAAAAWEWRLEAHPRDRRAGYAALQAARMHLKADALQQAMLRARQAETLQPNAQEARALVQEIRARLNEAATRPSSR